MNREAGLAKLEEVRTNWDLIITGGGATGLGIAVDAASRGYKTLLLEQSDFARGTSSRSTKLVHGGVRYLAQGDLRLVREALRERGILQRNAPHLVKNEIFIIPNYSWWDGLFYAAGLKLYDLLAGGLSFGPSAYISGKEVMRRMPNIKTRHLRSGVLYHDGQFDDARMAVNLAQTAVEQGATVLNYMRVTGLIRENNRIAGVHAADAETGAAYRLKGKTVINATGVFVDELLQMDQPQLRPMVKPSQGIHLVLDPSFLGSEDALLIPKTEDGRVLFAVPWHNRVVLGTTDTLLDEHTLEPVALEEEIEFILRNAGKYFTRAPQRRDVLSVFAGLRPLAAPQKENLKTREISRSHKIMVSPSGLITITGGKWTTYRQMAEDTVNRAIQTGDLSPRECITKTLAIHGSGTAAERNDPLSVYGSDQEALHQLIAEDPALARPLHPRLACTGAEVIWAVQKEMARTVDDVLARRTRALFLDARAALEMAPAVAALMAAALNRGAEWEKEQIVSFGKIARGYVIADQST